MQLVSETLFPYDQLFYELFNFYVTSRDSPCTSRVQLESTQLLGKKNYIDNEWIVN